MRGHNLTKRDQFTCLILFDSVSMRRQSLVFHSIGGKHILTSLLLIPTIIAINAHYIALVETLLQKHTVTIYNVIIKH